MISLQLNLESWIKSWTKLIHAELRCTKFNSDQLIPFSYTVDDADWSSTLDLQANYSDVIVTRNAYETVR